MPLIRKLALSFVLALSLPACSSTLVSFSPSLSSGEAPTVVTGKAIEVGPEDQSYLIKINAELIGWVVEERGDSDSASEAVREEAARRGGTHVFVPGTVQQDVTEGDRPSPHGPPVATVRRTARMLRYAVYRVPPVFWKDLPSDLAPWPLSSFQKP